MRRDSIFYALFQRSPSLLFELLETAPTNAHKYRFESVAVKEPKFEIDGVFLPPLAKKPGTIYFAEVQFQKDQKLYERLFGEVAPKVARMLLSRAEQETDSLAVKKGIIEMVSTIITYKFTNLSRQEIEAMLGTSLSETKVYQEAKAEGQEVAQQNIALKLLQENIPIEVIARTTGLTLKQLQALNTKPKAGSG